MMKAIIFDFDGTLVDSDPVTLLEFAHLMKHYNYPIPTDEQLHTLGGVPAIDMIKRLLPHLQREKINEMYEYKNRSGDEFMTKIKLFRHVKNVLTQLQSQYKLAIVTSRRRRGLDMLLQMHNLKHYFGVSIAKEDVVNHKPHPEGILKALQFFSIEKEDAMYVGDAQTDVFTARAAGVLCVIVSKLPEQYGEEYHVTGISGLPLFIETINQKAK